ncbi:hypothetical protein R5R35_007706 [Gryllus longicercus]|uniref:MD-2-related lipid-recognition domain-containing protein n=1 Tax=Gryllus longicercus TaxID=2509291 RepID=A0AAN9V772_9ORTH
MKSVAALAFLVACLATTSAVEILNCDKPQGKHSRSNDISLSACSPTRKLCRLKKRSDVSLEIKFSPEEDIEKLTNSVHANLLGLPFPFIGVDGTSACDSVFNADGSKAGCPLKKGQQYIYKHSLKVLDIYPKVQVDVHWALAYGNGKRAVCFEVPARIVS